MKRVLIVVALMCMVATASAERRPVWYDSISKSLNSTISGVTNILNAENYTLVKTLADLDNPMLPNTTYQINGAILATGTIVTADNVFIIGENFYTDGIVNLSTNILLAGTNSNMTISRCFLSSAGAPILDLFSSDGSHSLTIQSANMVNSYSIGCVDNYNYVIVSGAVVFDITTTNAAFSLCGSKIDKFYWADTVWNSQTNDLTMIDLGTSTCDFVQIDRSQFFMKSSNTVVLSGLTNSLNIRSPGQGTIRGNAFINTNGDHVVQTDVIHGVTKADTLWTFNENANLQDSKTQGGLQSTNEVTLPLTVDVFASLPGIFFEVAEDPLERFTFTTNGLVTLGGKQDITVSCSVSMVVNPSAGGLTKEFEFAVFKNGAVYPQYLKEITLSSKTGGSSIGWLIRIPMEVGDTLQLKVKNETDSSDLDMFQTFWMLSGD